MLTLTIPGRLSQDVADFAAASAAYAQARDLSGEGGSTFPEGRLDRAGVQIARLSYNARVWVAAPNGLLVYCPASAGRDDGRPDIFDNGRECAFSYREPPADLIPGSLEHRIFHAGYASVNRLRRTA